MGWEPRDAPEEAPLEPRPAFDAEEIQRRVETHFRVYEVDRRVPGLAIPEVVQFYIQTEPDTFTAKFEALRDSIRKLDPEFVVMHYHRLGEDRILVARKPPIAEKRPMLNLILLLLTVLTTSTAGAVFWSGYRDVEDLFLVGSLDMSYLHWSMLLMGFLTFCLPIMTILGLHELGHYVVAKRHRVRTSLPYFIPVPHFFLLFGTFGAFISMREPIPDRKALFDIGASGPILGFLVTLPVLILGTFLTATAAVPVPGEPELHERVEVQTPAGLVRFGEGGLVDGANATYLMETFSRDDAHVYRERVGLNVTALGLTWSSPGPGDSAAAPWKLVLRPANLREDQKVNVQVRYPAPANATPPSGFVEEDGRHVLRVDVVVAEHAPEYEVPFNLAANATQVTVSFDWERPPRGLIRLGESLFHYGLNAAVEYFYPSSGELMSHPTAIAGWVGLLVTGFNLLPAGTLDGGHVARALLGDRSRYASYAAIALMLILSFQFQGWLIMALLVLFLGLNHPPPLNDRTPLDPKRKTVAVIVAILFVVTMVPVPIEVL